MDLFPAIDLRDGRCVRLRQGDYAHETVYGDDPVAVASGFAAAGARWIHVVDLDAARTGTPVNRAVIGSIAAAVSPSGVKVQSGGGVRNREAATVLWDLGVARVVLGTVAIEDPPLVAELAAGRPGGVAIGVDTRAGEVAVRGWVAGSGVSTSEVLDRFAGSGVSAVIVTDIGRDGMLSGPDLEGLQMVLDSTDVDVIASGGVGSAADVAALSRMRGAAGRGLAGAIVGKAIYEGRLSVEEGLLACAASG